MLGRFWDRWPSPVVELLSGVGLVLALQSQGGKPEPFRQLVTAEAMSVGYELAVDSHGCCSDGDLVQRHQGIVLAVSLTALVRSLRHKP